MDHDMDSHLSNGSSGNGSGGEEGPVVESLCFEDADLVPAAMRALNMMRKNKHFCDVVLHTGCAEVPAHRAVLASASPYLMELFTADQDRSGGAVVLPLSYKLSGPCERKALMSLVDYAYTGKLSVPADQVRSVYLCAWQLRMDEVVRRCGGFLAGAWLARDTCLAVRALPGLAGEARATVDKYIADNFSSLYKSSTLSSLPWVQVEVLYTRRRDMDHMEHTLLAEMLLHWLREQITVYLVPVSSLCGRTYMLYEAGASGLQDCAALPPAHSDTPLLQDYRRMLLKFPPTKPSKRNGNGGSAPATTNGALYSRDIIERAHRQPGDDWAVIASEKLAEHTFLSLSTLDGHLVLLTASLRLNESPLASPGACGVGESPALAPAPPAVPLGPAGAPQPLASMERPRAAHGIAVLDNKIIVCGGYDRVECLNAVESYDPEKNQWTQLPHMRQQRGRFNIAQMGERIYAVGGSDGQVELDSVEMYEPAEEGQDPARSMTASLESQTGSVELAPHPEPQENTNGVNHQRKKPWTKRARMPLARSYAGVCGGAEGRVYCVGGWTDKAGVTDCHVYSTVHDTWSEMPSLNTGRYQVGLCVWGGALWAVGGCNAWQCHTSTELYGPLPPDTSSPGDWHFGPALSVARRGCGVAVWGSRLACVGGSNGQHSLRSMELLAQGGAWEAGPCLREPRTGVAVAALHDRLYAVGGYSGKIFLSSMEYLVEGTEEWTSFTVPFPAQLHLLPQVPEESLAKLALEERKEDHHSAENGDSKESQQPPASVGA